MPESNDSTRAPSRVCPSCGEERPASAFRSSHPRTHCEECHAAKGASRSSATPAPTPPPVDLTRRADELLMGDEAELELDELLERRALGRRRRLARAGVDADDCALLGLELDVGPRAAPHRAPVRVGDLWCSAIGAALLEAGVTADELERAAEWLRDRAGAS